MTLTDFLLARIAEDEGAAHYAASRDAVGDTDWGGWWFGHYHHYSRHDPARVLAECEAKRRIVEDYEILQADYRATRSPETEARRFQALVAIGQLAIVYADHADYDETWRP